MSRKVEDIAEAQAIRQMDSELDPPPVVPEVDQENAERPGTRSAAKPPTVADQPPRKTLKLRSDNIPSKSPSDSFKAPPTHDPEAESPSAIFWLNDDCLLEVMKYLPLKDVVNLLEADPRFRNAVEMRITNNEVDFHVENEFWNLPRFLEVFSKTVSILYLDMDSESELLRKFHHFENLERLVMTGNLKLSKFKVSELPTNFESLAIDGLEARNETPLKKWLRRMDPTLKKLEISYNLDYWDLVGELHNLESLSIMTEYSYPENLMENLKQNKKLRRLHLNSIQLADYPDLDQLTQLESLIIEEVNFFSWDELLEIPHKNLKILSVSCPKHFYLPSFKEITREFKNKFPELQFFIMDD